MAARFKLLPSQKLAACVKRTKCCFKIRAVEAKNVVSLWLEHQSDYVPLVSLEVTNNDKLVVVRYGSPQLRDVLETDELGCILDAAQALKSSSAART